MQPLTEIDLSNSYRTTLHRITAACQQCHRGVQDVALLAASKSQSAAKIRTVAGLGQRTFGENYAQELANKATELADLNLDWHFIGQIQSNKIKLLAKYSSCIQTISNIRHAQLLWDNLKEIGRLPFPIYVAVNAAGESQKSGIALADAETLANEILRLCPGLLIQGIMAIPPADLSRTLHAEVPPLYRTLRETADKIGEHRLSLGMSTDLDIAIAAGSNMVRIGTALFGDRLLKTS